MLNSCKFKTIDAGRGLPDYYLLCRYTRQAETAFLPNDEGVSVLLVPTAPTHYTIAEVQADPIAKNSALGDFAHFANVVDLCAVAIPIRTFAACELSGQSLEPTAENVKEVRLPFGVTLLGPRFADNEVLDLGERIMKAASGSSRPGNEATV